MSLQRRVEKLERESPERDGNCACVYPRLVEIRTHYPGDAEDDSPVAACDVWGGREAAD